MWIICAIVCAVLPAVLGRFGVQLDFLLISVLVARVLLLLENKRTRDLGDS